MFIVLEGADLAGKTTFCKSLSKDLNAEYFHFSKPKEDPKTYFSKVFNSLSPSSLGDEGEALGFKKSIICDRWVIGEKIYAKIKGEKSQWKRGDYEKMLKEMESRNGMLIIMYASKKTLTKRFNERGETYVTLPQIFKVQEMFIKEAARIAKAYPGIMVCLLESPGMEMKLLK